MLLDDSGQALGGLSALAVGLLVAHGGPVSRVVAYGGPVSRVIAYGGPVSRVVAHGGPVSRGKGSHLYN